MRQSEQADTRPLLAHKTITLPNPGTQICHFERICCVSCKGRVRILSPLRVPTFLLLIKATSFLGPSNQLLCFTIIRQDCQYPQSKNESIPGLENAAASAESPRTMAQPGQRVLRLRRTDRGGDPFVLLNVTSTASHPLDLKLVGTDGESVYVASSKCHKLSESPDIISSVRLRPYSLSVASFLRIFKICSLLLHRLCFY